MSYSASHGYRSIAELASQAPNFTLGILGDLHLSPDRQMRLFEEAKDQLVTVLESQQAKLGGGTACQAGLIQLGDVGGYHHQPGSLACFQRCRDWLAGFDLPVALITGNHDLEGLEFKTDALNLAAWQETFQQEHHWRVDVGPAILLGLGTSRFRSNQHSAHEVHVDAEQLAWFRNQLDASQGRPVIVFSHAPILGSGVRVGRWRAGGLGRRSTRQRSCSKECRGCSFMGACRLPIKNRQYIACTVPWYSSTTE
ncbi:hypothetical protein ACKKBF_B38445 [Auxenochlorella protothecoides x Auxenochlorella symbiontica]